MNVAEFDFPSPITATDLRWQAVSHKDKSADGNFVFAVKTTGIYCKPSCPSKPAKRENVVFFDTPALASGAGFRACKRCCPDDSAPGQKRDAMIEKVCELIASSETSPTLARLAAAVGLSPSHLQRLFRNATGISPKAYWQATQKARIAKSLIAAPLITDAIYDAGFNSSSRFYETADALLGMTPKSYRNKGKGEEIRFAVAPCSLGFVLVGATRRGVCTVELGDSGSILIESLHQRFANATFKPADEIFTNWMNLLLRHIESPGGTLKLPLDIQGTIFQQRVWLALQTIPAGETVTYTELAAHIGSPKAIRAVASACAANAVAVLVPCHRVIGANGALSGYRWGVERKAALLRREKSKGEA